MKRITALFILIVFLFNVGGYFFVFRAMETKVKRDLLTRLDADEYSSGELVVLTIPLSLPYPVGEGEYKRVDGDFEHNGQHYKLVKQKFENDTLFIVCIPDHETTRITEVFSDFTKIATNSLPVGSKQAVDFLSKLFKDFNTSDFTITYRTGLLTGDSFMPQRDLFIAGIRPHIDSPPPEAV